MMIVFVAVMIVKIVSTNNMTIEFIVGTGLISIAIFWIVTSFFYNVIEFPSIRSTNKKLLASMLWALIILCMFWGILLLKF